MPVFDLAKPFPLVAGRSPTEAIGTRFGTQLEAENAPRPSGTQTFTVGDFVHKARECAAITSAGYAPVRGEAGYGSKSGVRVCSGFCFTYGMAHAVDDENRHWNPESHKWQRRDEHGNFVR